MSEEKKCVAWQVTEDLEGCAVVVFHHDGLAARRIGADNLGCEFEDVSCSREPIFDQYATQGEVPKMALLEAGWWFECHYCGHEVTDDDEDMPLDEVVVAGSSVYCNQSCKD